MLVAILNPGVGLSQNIWTGDKDQNWIDPGNWSLGVAPTVLNAAAIVDSVDGSPIVSGPGGIYGNSYSSLTIGDSAAGAVTVRGSETTFGGFSLTVGKGADGSLYVLDGALLNTSTITVAEQSGVTGTIYIGDGGVAGRVNTIGNGDVFTGGAGTAVMNFDFSDLEYTFGANIHGSFSVNHYSEGVTTFTRNNTYSGDTNLYGGTLVLAGNLGATDVIVHGGATLRGGGVGNRSIGGHVTIMDGGRLVVSSTSPAVMTIGGDLNLGSDATIVFKLGQDAEGAGIGDALNVAGSVTLGGTLEVSNLGGFDDGTYTLINAGAGAGGDFATILLPDGASGTIDLVESSVVLIVGAVALDESWWAPDASFGGSGVWDTTTTNWTNESGGVETIWGEVRAVFSDTPGTVTVTEDVRFAGLRFDSDGYVLEGAGRLQANADVLDVNEAPRIAVADGMTATVGVQIDTGSRGLRKDDLGTLVLNTNQTYGGVTRINQGRVVLGDGGTTGMVAGNVQLDSTGSVLGFNRSGTVTMTNQVTGAGQVHLLGPGTVVLNSGWTYGGQTHIQAGTLQINQQGSLHAASTVSIDAGGTLAFNRQGGDLEFGNTIVGDGTIVQRGGSTSTVVLGGDLSDFTGLLQVTSGLLEITGTSFGGDLDIGGDLTLGGTTLDGVINVAGGGRLRGSGTVGGLTVESGGTVSPGNSFGAITVAGDLVFEEGAAYTVNADADGNTDLLQVTGSATLNGGNVLVIEVDDGESLWRPFNEYVILRADGGITGEFDSVDNQFAFLDSGLSYDGGVVVLSLDRNDVRFGGLAGLNANQRATGTGAEQLAIVDIEHGVVEALLPLSAGGAAQALTALSGEMHASVHGMLLEDAGFVRNAVLNNAGGPGGVWLQAIGHDGRAQSDGQQRFTRKTAGVFYGDNSALAMDNMSIGWALGFHRSEAESTALRSESDVNNIHAAVYGGGRWHGSAWMPNGGVGLRVGAVYGWHDVEMRRTVAFSGYEEALGAEYDANSQQVFAEVDYRWTGESGEIAPFVGVAWTRLSTDSFVEGDEGTEVGSTAALRSDSHAHDTSFATLGLRGSVGLGPKLLPEWSGRFASAYERLRLTGMLGVRQVLSGREAELDLRFLDGGSGAAISGVPLARTAYMADIGLDLTLTERARIGLAYAGQYGAYDIRDHALRAHLYITLP